MNTTATSEETDCKEFRKALGELLSAATHTFDTSPVAIATSMAMALAAWCAHYHIKFDNEMITINDLTSIIVTSHGLRERSRCWRFEDQPKKN